ncbi:unnamed protein product, partial [Iphiclides podalirius]
MSSSPLKSPNNWIRRGADSQSLKNTLSHGSKRRSGQCGGALCEACPRANRTAIRSSGSGSEPVSGSGARAAASRSVQRRASLAAPVSAPACASAPL